MNKSPRSLSVGFLYDDTLDNNDGVAQYVKTLGAWLSDQGHRVSYLVGETKMPQWAGGKVYSLARNRRVIFNGNHLSMPMPANRQKIKEVLAQEQFDVLHVQVPYSPLMAARVIEAADDQTAIVGTFHIYPSSPWVALGARFLRLVTSGSLKKFSRIVSVSAPAAEFAKKTFGISTVISPNMVDIKKMINKAQPKESKDVKRIVFLGRLVERKGCIQLLQAFNLLTDRLPATQLIIGGDGPQRQRLEQYVSRHGLSRKVSFRGFIEEAEKPALLASADVACFPSLYGESFGIVLIEAMAAGSGVVLGGNNPGYASVLGKRPKLLINPRNSHEFADRLAEVLTDKRLAESLHIWQQATIKQYDVNVVGKQIVDIYRQAIASQLKRRHN